MNWSDLKKMFGFSTIDIGELNRAALKAPPRPRPQPSDAPEIEVTPEYNQILEWLNAGVPIVFVTGKAGTGKSTLVRFLRDQFVGNSVVVAPTGVAALQVDGATIHSFFRFPPRVLMKEDIQLVRDRRLYRKIRLLILDEISMVRAEMLDAIDGFLRLNRDSQDAFGGVQLLMVGDLFQLPPVAKRNELEALQLMGYESPYFFSAKVFERCEMVSMELRKIYRQTEVEFISLLAKVREAEDMNGALPILNARCETSDGAGAKEGVITLTCTNQVADATNSRRLALLEGPERTYQGTVTGKFVVETEKLPSPINLTLKAGAQVMFTKNDQARRWVNGTLGTVVGFADEVIRVETGRGHQRTINEVARVAWESFKYEYDAVADKVIPVSAGKYVQFPLMLAWAVTIHKSQGKTLEMINVDLGTGAFEYGQVYVALSRCRALSDIQLARPIRAQDVRCDPVIKRFYSELDRRS